MHWWNFVFIFAIFAIIVIFFSQMPIHLGMHWCLAAVDLRHMTINYYDR